MYSVIKLSLIAVLSLTLVSCSGNKSSNKNSNIYHGGELADDGHRLPFMPDEDLNDSTLLGIDTNNNSIRDDVEIYIYNRFQGYTNSKVEREIAKQYARTAAQLIQNPENAYRDKKHEILFRAIDCENYYYDTYLKNVTTYNEEIKYIMEHRVFNPEFKDVVFNTKERLYAFFKYNASMSGHVFQDTAWTKDNCDFDPDPLIEGTL
jgi:hypothetical protein